MKYFIFLGLIVTAGPGCGVRGDPIPPGYPAELGRGRPAFQTPDKAMSYPPLPDAKTLEERLKEEDED